MMDFQNTMSSQDKKIVVDRKGLRVFFHVFGDNREYYDIDSVLFSHKELRSYIASHTYELESSLLQTREKYGAYEVLGG